MELAPAALPASPNPHSMSQPTEVGSARSPLSQSRRGALGTFGFGALALIASNNRASALSSAKETPRVVVNSSSGSTPRVVAVAPPGIDLSTLPAEWVLRQGSELKVYAAYLA